MTDRLFPALLKYWRGRGGYSQLELALATEVSARHLSFLETGRARPSQAMVLRLMAALDLPLRDQNDLLRTAGFGPRFAEPALDAVAPAVDWAIERMLHQQEPYPLLLLDADYGVVRGNDAARRVFATFVDEPARLSEPLNMYTLLFDPGLVRPFVVDWERLARKMVARLHREALRQQGDSRLAALLTRALAYPGVPREWRQPDFSADSDATLTVTLRRGDLTLGFLTTLTAFSAPQLVTLQELRIESYFPLDAQTQQVCERLAAQARTAAPRSDPTC